MTLAKITLLTLLVTVNLGQCLAQSLPDLKNQAAWSEKEKQEFLKFLKSGQQTPVFGDVKQTSQKSGPESLSRARYLTLEGIGESFMPVDGTGRLYTGKPEFGARALVGGHLFSWIRYYTGLQFNNITLKSNSGSVTHPAHFTIPAGIELALIPLGTPQTRYAILRFGASAHYINGSAKKSDLTTNVLGWNGAWNAGLGYEWQLDNSNWRLHALAEGYRSFGTKPRFYGAGFTLGLVRTF